MMIRGEGTTTGSYPNFSCVNDIQVVADTLAVSIYNQGDRAEGLSSRLPTSIYIVGRSRESMEDIYRRFQRSLELEMEFVCTQHHCLAVTAKEVVSLIPREEACNAPVA